MLRQAPNSRGWLLSAVEVHAHYTMSSSNNAGLTDDEALAAAIAASETDDRALAAAIAASASITSTTPASAKRFVGIDQQIASIVVGTRFSEVNAIAQRVGFACRITLQFPESEQRYSCLCMDARTMNKQVVCLSRV